MYKYNTLEEALAYDAMVMQALSAGGPIAIERWTDVVEVGGFFYVTPHPNFPDENATVENPPQAEGEV